MARTLAKSSSRVEDLYTESQQSIPTFPAETIGMHSTIPVIVQKYYKKIETLKSGFIFPPYQTSASSLPGKLEARKSAKMTYSFSRSRLYIPVSIRIPEDPWEFPRAVHLYVREQREGSLQWRNILAECVPSASTTDETTWRQIGRHGPSRRLGVTGAATCTRRRRRRQY